MCSVIGYIGNSYSRTHILAGLLRLEYRGYDAAGFACLNPLTNKVEFAKTGGKVCNLIDRLKENPIDGFLGIGHTRWSTHGISSPENAHPHFDCKKKISIVHNGIIENHQELRASLVKDGNHIFYSETDTEIIAHLLEVALYTEKNLEQALYSVVSQLEGAYAIVGILEEFPDKLILIRKRSPLCIGHGINEMFIASDPLAFADQTNKVTYLPDETFAIITKETCEIVNFEGKKLIVPAVEINLKLDIQEKNGHEHFMLKEIYEQKIAIKHTIEWLETIDLFKQCGISEEYMQSLDNLHIIGCGSSWHAGRIAQFFFEQIAQFPTTIHLASEFRYMSFFPQKNSLYVAISQSGETADSLESVHLIKNFSIPVISITNSAVSSIVRETDGHLLTQAGREIAVASTKAFSTQLVVLYWFAHRIALAKKLISSVQVSQALDELYLVSELLEKLITRYRHSIVHEHALKYGQARKVIFLGRHITYPFAMEAALKLKEIAYIFSQCYAAGELKHGPLALIDSEVPVFVFSHEDPLIYQKLLSNAQEVKARRGHVVAFAYEGQDELCQLANLYFILPRINNPLLGPLLMTGLMQFFVYAIANYLGCSIDKPRNLAKSVTVE